MAISETNENVAELRTCWTSEFVAASNLRFFDPAFRGDRSPADDFRLMLFIRRFEEALLELFQAGKVNGTTHTCIGQEYIPVALMPLLRDGDFIFSNHRGHGHYLARFLDPEGLMCEILGREGAVCDGVGGSQHIRRGRYFSTGVQGESVPVAAGAALSLKRENAGEMAVAFIGDGTWGEGSVYEALNLASLWSVPLVIICENNGIAQTTPTQQNMAGSIANRATAFDVEFVGLETQEVAEIRTTLGPVLQRVRESHQPLVVEFKTQRLASHSKGDDTRREAELSGLREKDWYSSSRVLSQQEKEIVEGEVNLAIKKLRAEVSGRKPSVWRVNQ